MEKLQATVPSTAADGVSVAPGDPRHLLPTATSHASLRAHHHGRGPDDVELFGTTEGENARRVMQVVQDIHIKKA